MTAFDCIPAELRELPRWVVWRWGDVDPKTGTRKKPPYCPSDHNRHASSTKPETWGSFEQAVTLVNFGAVDGLGFALTPPYVGVDLDEELTETEQWVIMLALDSYAERSASGSGFHVIVRADLNGRGRHPVGFGVFQDARFFYCTGEHVPELPATIDERQAELEEVLAQYLPAPTTASPTPPSQPVDADDQELLERAIAAKNGADFEALWNGQWEGRYPSRSEADIALAGKLAFWTGRDPERIDRMVRASGLMRPKWTREDYAQRTIQAAIGATTNVCKNPSKPRWASNAADAAKGRLGAARGSSVAASALKDAATPNAAPRRERSEAEKTEFDAAADAVEPERPFALPIAEFVALPRERREPMLADADGRAVVGLHSLVLLGALGGHGKTTLFIDLALHLAAGVDYPPWTVPRPISVLMIENEGPEQLFAEKLGARLATFPHELRGRLDVCTFDWGGFSLADNAHRQRLTDEIADKGYDLVFGDPLDSLGIEGVGSPEDTRQFLALMKQTGLNRTCAWWLNTHPRKEETKEALNEISGAWGGKPDTVFLLKMLADDRTQLRQPKLRWARRGKGPTVLFGFDPDTESFSHLGEESEVERDYFAEIRKLLADGEWRAVKEIAAKAEDGGIAASDKTVKKVLEEHPDAFESRTGAEAKALDRSPTAILWQLRRDVAESDGIIWADVQEAALDVQRRTGKFVNPLSEVIAETRSKE